MDPQNGIYLLYRMINLLAFVNSEFINPRILEDLVGWLSDSGDQVVSRNIAESNTSNSYHGTVTLENNM